jgi:hypothetical protein
MKTKIIFLLMIVLFSTNIFAQKQSATAFVQSFYRFHLTHEDIFNEKQVAIRRRFFTPKLQLFFKNELKREALYHKKYPENKPYFEGLDFDPQEFCQTGYRIGNTKMNRLKAVVEINFKNDCDQRNNDLTVYKIELTKIGGKWLIDNVIFDDGETLIDAFNKAMKIE